MRSLTRMRAVAALAGLTLVIGGCAAASHLRALQPPSVKATGAIALPVDHQAPATSGGVPQFQAGIDVDWYHGPGQSVAADALATAAYIQRLNANSVSISFPFFMDGTRSGSVHGTISTPSPAQLATAIGIFKQAGLYVSLRPLLAEGSLGRYRDGWVPYALMARRAGVGEFIIGSELTGIYHSPRWATLTRLMGTWYGGTLACADNWPRIVANGCGVATQTVDAYHPADSTNFLAAWEQWDHTLPHGMAETEVGIAAAKGAQKKPWNLNWPVHRTDPQLQANWFSAACKAAVMTHLGGIYFWSIGLTQNNPVGPTLARQTTWTGGPGARAIATCFRKIAR
jgi:hypothetical protein